MAELLERLSATATPCGCGGKEEPTPLISIRMARNARAAEREGAISLPPCPGRSSNSWFRKGASVEAGDILLVVEAMKMQLEIKAPHAGVVTGLPHGEGDTVAAGELLAHLEASA